MNVIHQPPTNDIQADVMIVDDDECLRDAMTLLLKRRGYRVRCCCDALEALAQLAAESEPDVILLDLLVLQMDGWEFRVKQRRVPKWAGIPLIVLSGALRSRPRRSTRTRTCPSPSSSGSCSKRSRTCSRRACAPPWRENTSTGCARSRRSSGGG